MDDTIDRSIERNMSYNQRLYVCDEEGGSSSGGSGDNGSRTSVSEIAGQRLYQNALDTQKKIEEKSKERNNVPLPTLTLATRGRRSREASPVPGQPPRYVQLYEKSKTKITSEAEKESPVVVQTRDVSPAQKESCERLYSLSAQKQQEGKERREEILKSKSKPPLPESHFRKIPTSQATKIYDRGMKHLISLEMKRMEAAFESEENYSSPLVPKSKEKGFTANE
mmetsp:Transcript_6367/g.7885  ORF Transcript_6367/g.7885 Transcript_6367/m.7885 type:complete len:224 (+) Transcript_6367:95-766(+)